VHGFGTNPGQLRFYLHLPPRQPVPGAPLIVILHGCRQDAAGFAADGGWIALADRLGVPLVLPEQSFTNHRLRCFSWYRPGDVGRGEGEALSIRQMAGFAMRHLGSDRRRVFVAGLSAGGAMAAALLAAYPAVFAAGAVVAGLPVGTAGSAPMAMLRMHRADPWRTEAGLVAAARGARPAGARWPRLSVWHGSADRSVDPAHAELLVAQWLGLHRLDFHPAGWPSCGPGCSGGAGAARPSPPSSNGRWRGWAMASPSRRAAGPAPGCSMPASPLWSTSPPSGAWKRCPAELSQAASPGDRGGWRGCTGRGTAAPPARRAPADVAR
jgi:poly(hydroxyalkanoate) depolymerase family esterase